jgi:hypothetical protein
MHSNKLNRFAWSIMNTRQHQIVIAKSLPLTLLMLAGIAPSLGCDGEGEDQADTQTVRSVAGAGFSTFDESRGGCLDSKNGVDCNNYEAKDAVYMSGGPTAAGLSNGDYYFAVLAPGYQNGGFIEDADGNLSDTVAGATEGDRGSGDDIGNRTFRVVNHEIVGYTGTHAWGRSPLGKDILQLLPFDDTDNPGGVYVLAICRVDAISPSECKYDAFRIRNGTDVEFGTVSGGKYYDTNTNGVREDGEPGLPGWLINYVDGVIGQLTTDSTGNFRIELVADTYTFAEVTPILSPAWIQTGNRRDQSSTSGDVSVMLNWDMSYDVVVVDNGSAENLWFGNVCVGGGGGHTLGYWSNKNGSALLTSADFALLSALSLVDATGAAFDPTSKQALSSWLRSGSANNMAYMLSVQLAAMELNVAHDFVDPNALIYAPGVRASNMNGFTTIIELLDAAEIALAANPVTIDPSSERTYQESLKDALDGANNDRSFVQPTPATCPAPIFTDFAP